MATIEWDELSPTGASYLSDLGPKWRSVKSNIDTALRQHFYWSDSTSSAGEPRLSTTTPGSCRAYDGARSAVSHPGRDGALMYVSDETRLLVFTPSAQSVVVGSQRALVGFRSSVFTQLANCRWLVQRGTADLVTGTDNSVLFPTAYGAPPLVFITPGGQTAASANSYAYGIFAGGGDEKSGFSVSANYLLSIDPTDARVYWYSEGTVAL